jgi:hypothetical protein
MSPRWWRFVLTALESKKKTKQFYTAVTKQAQKEAGTSSPTSA